MRELIIARIKELKEDSRYNAWRLWSKHGAFHGRDVEKLHELNDDELLDMFERVVMMAYKAY